MVGGNVEGGWVNTTNIKEVPSQSCALWCVYMCVHLCTFSGEAQQVLTGPPSSLHSPRKPRLFFFCVLYVFVCQQARSAQCGSDVMKWLTGEQSQGWLWAVVGREGPYSLTAFRPEGKRERQRYGERKGRDSLNRLIRHTEMETPWLNEHETVAKQMMCCMVGSHRNLLDGWTETGKIKTELTTGKRQSWFFLITLPVSLISWVGNPGDHRGLWEMAHAQRVM